MSINFLTYDSGCIKFSMDVERADQTKVQAYVYVLY